MDKSLNPWIKKLFSDGSSMWREWSTKIAKMVNIGECVGSRSLGRRKKRWIDTVKDCIKKRGLDGASHGG